MSTKGSRGRRDGLPPDDPRLAEFLKHCLPRRCKCPDVCLLCPDGKEPEIKTLLHLSSAASEAPEGADMSEMMGSNSIRKVARINVTVSAYVKTAMLTGDHVGAASDCIIALAGELERLRVRAARSLERECPDMRVHFPDPCEHPSSDGNADGRYICCECGADEGPVALAHKPATEEVGEVRGPVADEDGCCLSCGRGLEPCPACQEVSGE